MREMSNVSDQKVCLLYEIGQGARNRCTINKKFIILKALLDLWKCRVLVQFRRKKRPKIVFRK